MQKPVLIETSARHVHVSRRVLDILFGEGYELTHKKDLSQPGQFACEERVQVIGPKNSFPAVSILGPVRPETQVELSAGDARAIGVKAPIRESGDLEGTTGGLKLVGPCGELDLEKGVIAAKRHIHMTPADAANYGVGNGDIVAVKVVTDGRTTVFGDTVIRVSESYSLAMHIDTDEANAAGIAGTAAGEIVNI